MTAIPPLPQSNPTSAPLPEHLNQLASRLSDLGVEHDRETLDALQAMLDQWSVKEPSDMILAEFHDMAKGEMKDAKQMAEWEAAQPIRELPPFRERYEEAERQYRKSGLSARQALDRMLGRRR